MQFDISGRALAGLAVVVMGVGAYFSAARAGELKPPAGAVNPTMTSLQEVGDSVADLAPRVSVPANIVAAAIEYVVGPGGQILPQDDFIGSDPIVGRCYDLRPGVRAERDQASGLPTGKRQHKPFVITKEIDKSSPLFMQALVNNEIIPCVKVATWGQNAAGGSTRIYSIELVNAHVVEMSQALQDVSGGGQAQVEQIQLTYQTIIWTWIDGGLTAQDDWATPVAP